MEDKLFSLDIAQYVVPLLFVEEDEAVLEF